MRIVYCSGGRGWGIAAGSGPGKPRRVMYLRRVINGCMWRLTEGMGMSRALDRNQVLNVQ